MRRRSLNLAGVRTWRTDSETQGHCTRTARKIRAAPRLRAARGRTGPSSPPFSVIRAPGRAPRSRLADRGRHKQSEILKHCRAKCDNSAWLLTPLDRKYPSYAARAASANIRARRGRKALGEAPIGAVPRDISLSRG